MLKELSETEAAVARASKRQQKTQRSLRTGSKGRSCDSVSYSVGGPRSIGSDPLANPSGGKDGRGHARDAIQNNHNNEDNPAIVVVDVNQGGCDSDSMLTASYSTEYMPSSTMTTTTAATQAQEEERRTNFAAGETKTEVDPMEY